MKRSKTISERIRQLDSDYWLRISIVVVLSILSFYTSFDGVTRYIETDESQASFGAVFFLACLVIIIQLLLIMSLGKLSQSMSWQAKLKWLMMYLLGMLVSVFLSFAFYTGLLQAENYAAENFSTQFSYSVQHADAYKNNFIAIKNTAQTLAAYSVATSKTERFQGGTCGDNSLPGAGPRRDLRDQEANFFLEISENISTLTEKMKAHIQTLADIQQRYRPNGDDISAIQRQMNQVIAGINQQRHSGTMKQIKQRLQQHRGDARHQLWVETRQHTVNCPDQKISHAIDIFLSDLQDLPILEDIALFDAGNNRAVMERAAFVFMAIPSLVYDAVFSPVYAAEDAPLVKAATAITSADLMPIFLASGVDLIIFIIGFSGGRKAAQDGYLKYPYRGEYFSSNDIEKILAAFDIDASTLRKLMRSLLYIEKKQRFLIIPTDADDAFIHSDTLVDLFESLVANQRIAEANPQQIPLSVIPSSVQREVKKRSRGSIDHLCFNFYPMSHNQWHDWVQAINAYIIWEKK